MFAGGYTMKKNKSLNINLTTTQKVTLIPNTLFLRQRFVTRLSFLLLTLVVLFFFIPLKSVQARTPTFQQCQNVPIEDLVNEYLILLVNGGASGMGWLCKDHFSQGYFYPLFYRFYSGEDVADLDYKDLQEKVLFIDPKKDVYFLSDLVQQVDPVTKNPVKVWDVEYTLKRGHGQKTKGNFTFRRALSQGEVNDFGCGMGPPRLSFYSPPCFQFEEKSPYYKKSPVGQRVKIQHIKIPENMILNHYE
jgi:hypothetical protein